MPRKILPMEGGSEAEADEGIFMRGFKNETINTTNSNW